MAMEIFRLVGSIFVDNDAANQSISKTDEKAQGVGKTLLNGIGTAAKWGAGIVAGASAAIGGVTAFASKTASAADEIDKMSQKIGISREAYQELDFILSQNGMDVSKLQTGLKSMTSQMYAAEQGTASAAAYFDQMGVSIYDSAGALRSQEAVFYDTINALQGMENETQRNALAAKVFGRSATELAPLLNGGAGSMEELRQKAHDLGLVLSDEVVDSGVQLTDTMDQLKRAGGAIFNRLGGVVMPLVQRFAAFLISQLPMVEGMLSTLTPVIESVFTQLVPPLMTLASSVLPAASRILGALLPPATQIINAILPVVVDLMDMLLPGLIDVVETLLPPLLDMLTPLLDLLGPLIQLLQPILDLVTAILKPLADLISGLLKPLITVISSLISVALVPLKSTFELVSDAVSRTFTAAVELIMSRVDAVKGVFSGLIQFIKGVFTGDWKSAWEGVTKIFSSIWEGIKSAFKIPINWIIDGINTFIRGVNKIKIPDWVPGVGGRGFSISTIPRLAAGGVLEKGQMGFLEGTGAEAVVPLENNRKWIRSLAADMQDEGIGGSDRVIDLLASILEQLEDLARAGIYLDKDRLVGALAGPLDKRMGLIAAQKGRA